MWVVGELVKLADHRLAVDRWTLGNWIRGSKITVEQRRRRQAREGNKEILFLGDAGYSGNARRRGLPGLETYVLFVTDRSSDEKR
jgi:hypothetical protein